MILSDMFIADSSVINAVVYQGEKQCNVREIFAFWHIEFDFCLPRVMCNEKQTDYF